MSHQNHNPSLLSSVHQLRTFVDTRSHHSLNRFRSHNLTLHRNKKVPCIHHPSTLRRDKHHRNNKLVHHRALWMDLCLRGRLFHLLTRRVRNLENSLIARFSDLMFTKESFFAWENKQSPWSSSALGSKFCTYTKKQKFITK